MVFEIVVKTSEQALCLYCSNWKKVQKKKLS